MSSILLTHNCCLLKVDLHGMHVEEALSVLENHLLNLGGLGCPSGVLLQVGGLLAWENSVKPLSAQIAL